MITTHGKATRDNEVGAVERSRAARGLEHAQSASSSSEHDLELTILMPCLNEARTVEACVRSAQQFIDQSGARAEVLIADNGSTDGSQQLALELGARVVDVPVKGYGATIYHGTRAARGRYVIVGDADGSYDFADLTTFLEKLRDGNDLVMGNRFAGGIRPGAMPWKNRYIGNPVLSGIGRRLFRSPVKDFHCGLRGYTKRAFDRMELQTTGMEFASEMVIKAAMLGLRVAEVPTTLSVDGRGRRPHLRPFRDGWRHLRFMLLYSPRWVFLYPGVALVVLGSLVLVWLLPGSRNVFGVGFDVHTLLYAAMAILVGAQAVGFAVLTRVTAARAGLLPRQVWPRELSLTISLETWLAIGGTLLVLGLAGSVASVIVWGAEEFSALDARAMLRLIVPAITAMMLGLQLMLFAFFASVLKLDTRRTPSGSHRLDSPAPRPIP